MQIDRAIGSLVTQLGEQQLFSDETQMMAVFYDDPDSVPKQDLRARACSPVAVDAPGFESYLNSPQDVVPTELLTDICLPRVS